MRVLIIEDEILIAYYLEALIVSFGHEVAVCEGSRFRLKRLWSPVCSGPSWISARVRPHYRTGLDWVPFGSPVFACAGKTDPPSLLILSQTSGWKRLIGLRHRLLLIPRSSFVRAKSSRSFVPARRTSIASRAGAVKAGRCAWLAAGSGVARPRLDGAEHGARIKRVGRLHRRSSSARRRVLSPAPPRRCGQACWRARSPARCGATAAWRLRSRI
jgi:hypothetical protein